MLPVPSSPLVPVVEHVEADPALALGLDSIFYDPESHILFASFKYIGYDWAGDMEKMAENPKVQEWWRMTDSYQESLVEGATSSVAGSPPWWKGLQEVFWTA
jgi:L-rhamnose mutarotase